MKTDDRIAPSKAIEQPEPKLLSMTTSTTVASCSATNNGEDLTTPLNRPARYFFIVMSFLFLIISALGFVPRYQAMYNGTLRFPIHWLAHVHGALMTTWLLVFITQTILAAKGYLKFHRQLGLFSIGIGVLIWISMWVASARALISFNPPVGHFLFDVLIIQCYGIVLFGLFFIWGILERKHGAIHKRLLFLSTLSLMQAAIDRMHWLPGLHTALYIRFFYLDALLILLYIYDWFILKRIHKVTWIGSLLYIISQVIVTMTWGSPAWHNFWFNLMNGFR
ncbi:MAG TPA: hypothetical protein VFZ52_20725 [Chryseolinea sp.]